MIPQKPPNKEQGSIIRTNLRREELKKLSEIAQRGGRSRSGLISYTLRKLIETEQRDEETPS